MKKAIAMKWVKALRSGKYKQGKERLKTEDGKYCCLGVLCEITKDQTGGAWDAHGSFALRNARERCLLPQSVRVVVGMGSACGLLPEEARKKLLKTDLIQLNDWGGYGFKRIARIIEKYWKDL